MDQHQQLADGEQKEDSNRARRPGICCEQRKMWENSEVSILDSSGIRWNCGKLSWQNKECHVHRGQTTFQTVIIF